ncbi:MFS transporter [Nocardia rhamnosiphila]|uniref:MFS transporter n=1 Tax=Nocardia rhamnosiphila TaxID=426716 RepID=UPI003410C3A4
MTQPDSIRGHRTGSKAYRHATLALFAAGMATFMTLWYVQGLLPTFSTEFSVTPTVSALAVSATTAMLALMIVPASMLSERFGRVPVMAFSALSSTAVGLLLPWSPSFEVLVAGRALQGILCAGLPAVAMAYLVEELDARDIGKAMGTYVAGTSIGGLTGRLIPTFGLDILAWHWAFQLVTALAALFAVVFVWKVPASANFTPRRIPVRQVFAEQAAHLRNRTLLCLFGLGFLLLGAFMAVYNYLAYRLLQEPFSLPATLVGSVFLLYLAGTASSAVAGRFGDRVGRGRVLLVAILVMGAGLAMTLANSLGILLTGVGLITAGFFAAHSIASGWVPLRAPTNRSGASSLYLLAYYLGSALLGALAGPAFAEYAWPGLAIYVAVILVVSVSLALVLLWTDTPYTSRDTVPPSHTARAPSEAPTGTGSVLVRSGRLDKVEPLS